MTSSLKLFLILYYIKKIDSKLPCVCSVIDYKGRQNVVRTSVTHSVAPRVPLFCSYHILTSSVIYYWTDARQLGVYLLNLESEINPIDIMNVEGPQLNQNENENFKLIFFAWNEFMYWLVSGSLFCLNLCNYSFIHWLIFCSIYFQVDTAG